MPFGLLLLLDHLAARHDAVAVGHPIAYSTSIAAPPLPLTDVGLGATAPATLEHFVGYPASAFSGRPRRGAGSSRPSTRSRAK